MFKHLGKDLPASLIVFLVAIPLCLGIALASGAPLFSGIIAGIVGGIVVGSLSGSNLGVSGPAAGLAVIVADAIIQLGTNEEGVFSMEVGFELFLSAVIIGGVIQIALGFAKAGIIGYFFPSAVIKGMLSAIGIIIILKQIPHALGHDVVAEGFEGFWQKDGENTFTELLVAMGDINPAAVIVSVLSLGILILWEQSFMKKIRVFQLIQGPLVVVVLGMIMTNLFLQMDGFQFDQDEMVGLPILQEGESFVSLLTFPNFSGFRMSEIWVIGITLAIVASLETLLSVEATDKLDPAKPKTPTNRELLSQGVGNVISGFIGGLPITQVIVRSSANIQSGGKTKLSTITHGFLILGSILVFPEIMNMIPLSSLAAILFLVGYKLAKPAMFKAMYKANRTQFHIFIITVLSIVFTDLLMGIGIGLVFAIFSILRKNFSVPFSFSEKIEDDKPIEVQLSENVSFLNKPSVLKALHALPEGSDVIIDARKSHYVHPDIIEILKDFIEDAPNKNINVEVKGNFDEINEDHLNYFMKKVSKSEYKKTPYWESILKN